MPSFDFVLFGDEDIITGNLSSLFSVSVQTAIEDKNREP